MADDVLDFLVSREDLRETTFETSSVVEDFEREDLGVLLKVDQLALTPNSITYAVVGDSMDRSELCARAPAGVAPSLLALLLDALSEPQQPRDLRDPSALFAGPRSARRTLQQQEADRLTE